MPDEIIIPGHDPKAADTNRDVLIAQFINNDTSIAVAWPDDPMRAQRLFIELEYQFRRAMLEQTQIRGAEVAMREQRLMSQINGATRS